MLRKNDLCRVEITELNNLGFGVGRVDGMVMFVSHAVDGDVVEARVVRVAAGYAVGRTERILSPSLHRVPSPCAAKGCGGCAYLTVSAAHEAEIKRESVAAAFARAGVSIRVNPLVTTGERYHYRNKAQYPVAAKKDGGVAIGFFAPKSHRVVEAEDCLLGDPAFSPILRCLHEWIDRYHIPPYREEDGSGLLRHIYLRAGKATGEILLVLVVNGAYLPREEELVAELREKFPAIVGILLNRNEADTNVICGEEYRTLWGKPYLRDVLCGVTLHLSPASFYQVNHDVAELLYRRARELAALRGDELLLDLFCGVGSIGLSMADGVREVIGMEIVESAVRCASENAAQNGIRNASFYCGDATDAEGLLAAAERERGARILPDVVILDPPRRGCDAALLSYLARLAPSRVIYISCNPETLARDMKILAPLGYTAEEVTPFDLFPCTGHVEALVCLRRRADKEEMS